LLYIHDILVFHESVVDLIKKEKLSGFVFVPVEEYTEVIQDEKEEEAGSKDGKEEGTKQEKKKKRFSFYLD
jgi:hypothetical protein